MRIDLAGFQGDATVGYRVMSIRIKIVDIRYGGWLVRTSRHFRANSGPPYPIELLRHPVILGYTQIELMRHPTDPLLVFSTQLPNSQ